MKLSVVLFVVLMASVCAGDDQQKAMQELEKKCLAETKMTLEVAYKCMKEHKYTGECAKIGCVQECIFQGQGLMNKDGTVKLEVIKQIVQSLKEQGHPKSSAAVQKCFVNPKKKAASCENGQTIDVCLHTEPHD